MQQRVQVMGIREGLSIEQVAAKLGPSFKKDPEQMAQMLRQPFSLNVPDEATATKYRAFLEAAGCICAPPPRSVPVPELSMAPDPVHLRSSQPQPEQQQQSSLSMMYENPKDRPLPRSAPVKTPEYETPHYNRARPTSPGLIRFGIFMLVLALIGVGRICWNFIVAHDLIGAWKTPLPLVAVGDHRISSTALYTAMINPQGLLISWGSASAGDLTRDKDKVVFPKLMDGDAKTWRALDASESAVYALDTAGKLQRRPLGTGGMSLAPYAPTFTAQHWTKVQQGPGYTLGLTAEGKLLFWRERDFADGAIRIRIESDHGDGNSTSTSYSLPLAADGALELKTDAELTEMDTADRAAAQKALHDAEAAMRNGGSYDDMYALRAQVQANGSDIEQSQSQRRTGYALARTFPYPAQVLGGHKWVDFCISPIVAYQSVIYGIDDTGALWQVYSDQLSRLQYYNDSALSLEAQPVKVGAPLQRLWCQKDLDYVYALDNERHLWQTAFDPTGKRMPEPQLMPERTWARIAPGYRCAVGLDARGRMWAWGGGYDHLILDPKAHIGEDYHSGAADGPIQVGSDRSWTDVEVSANHVVAVDDKGQIYTWGHNVEGVLADGDVAQYRESPQPVRSSKP